MTNKLLKLKYDNQYLAYKQSQCKSNKNVIFFGGYCSDMDGTKARYLHEYCANKNWRFTRFDYYGHGKSSGDFLQGNISLWLENCLLMMDKIVNKPTVIIGSSMGGWLALLVALKRPKLVRAIIGIAAAPDFSERLVWDNMSDSQKMDLRKNKIINFGAEICGDGLPFSSNLIEDGRKYLLLSNQIDITCPVRLFHGMKDLDVPFEFSIKTSELLESEDVKVILKKNSDHRMSSEDDLKDVSFALDKIIERVF